MPSFAQIQEFAHWLEIKLKQDYRVLLPVHVVSARDENYSSFFEAGVNERSHLRREPSCCNSMPLRRNRSNFTDVSTFHVTHQKRPFSFVIRNQSGVGGKLDWQSPSRLRVVQPNRITRSINSIAIFLKRNHLPHPPIFPNVTTSSMEPWSHGRQRNSIFPPIKRLARKDLKTSARRRSSIISSCVLQKDILKRCLPSWRLMGQFPTSYSARGVLAHFKPKLWGRPVLSFSDNSPLCDE